MEQLRQIAEETITRIEAEQARMREESRFGESLATHWVNTLEHRVASAESARDQASASLPKDDPRQRHDELLTEWQAARLEWEQARGRWENAAQRLAELQQSPEPSSGMVSAERRRQVFELDLSLQQDLRELEVKLAELKLHMLQVWQTSAAPLDELQKCADRMHGFLTGEVSRGFATRDALQGQSQQYLEALKALAQLWNAEFARLRALPVDSQSGEILDAHHRLRTGLNDFLFKASPHLGTIRQSIHDGSGQSLDDARHHVLYSSAARTFHALQTGHHRFEFAAGLIEPRGNFRLDAAFAAARGLRNRTQARIKALDQTLQAEAAEEARRQSARDLEAAVAEAGRLREQADEAARRMVGLQEELNEASQAAETFLDRWSHKETAAVNFASAAVQLNDVQRFIQELASRRESMPDGPPLVLHAVKADPVPVNRSERLTLASAALVLTTVLAYFAQGWLLRRPVV
jgi:hypothetical protein